VTGSDELRRLAGELRAVNVKRLGGPVMSKAGAQMRDRAREAAPAGPHLRSYRRQIVFTKDGPLAVEVGARAVGQGNLSAVLEFGQGANAPHPHIVPQLDPEAEAAAQWLAQVLADAL